MYLLLFLECSMRLLIGLIQPLALSGTAPGGVTNYVIAPLALLMLFLALEKNKFN